MINRLKDYFGEPEPARPERDFWEVASEDGWYYVSQETAQEIARQLARARPPRWMRFRDLFGSEIRIRSRDVHRIAECTAAQRAAERGFRRALREEDERSDPRPWEDE